MKLLGPSEGGKRLWLDDERPPPPDYDYWVKTADECIEALDSGLYSHVSLDHDLAAEHYHGDLPAKEAYKEKTGMAVVDWMVEHEKIPWSIRIHTMNPVGRKNMANALRAFLERNQDEGHVRAPFNPRVEIRVYDYRVDLSPDLRRPT